MTPRKPNRRPRMSIAIVALVSALAGGLAVVLPGAATVSRPQAVAVSSLRPAGPGPAANQASDSQARRHQLRRRKPRHVGRSHRKKRRRRSVRVGPAGLPGPQGPPGPAGPDISTALTINWRGLDSAPGHDTAAGQIVGIGTLLVTCNATTQTLNLLPAGNGTRSVLDVTTFRGEGTEGTSSNQRLASESSAPISVDLPSNGMISGTISAEPISDGGQLAAPATFLLSSEWKSNDPDPSLNYCYVATQVLQQP